MPHSSSRPSRVTSRVVLSDESVELPSEFLKNIPAWCIAQREPQTTPVHIKVSTPHSARGDPKASTFGLDHKHPLINKLLNREMDPRFAEISVKRFVKDFLPGEGLNSEELSKLQDFDRLTNVVQAVAANKARNKGKKRKKKKKANSSDERATTSGGTSKDSSDASEQTDDVEDDTDETSETGEDEVTSEDQDGADGQDLTSGEQPHTGSANGESIFTPYPSLNTNQTIVHPVPTDNEKEPDIGQMKERDMYPILVRFAVYAA
jgi:Mg-chelatase subunit ChlI